jgi:glycosyltransferase involved in cell wall biosynthesis
VNAAVNRESPQVSIVMPVFNAALWLEQSLASVLTQSLRDFELIAVNDSSSDGSLEILRSAAATDSRIRVLKSKEKGIVPALNTGVAAARAPFIARMDADDLMPTHRLSIQSEYLERNPDITLVSGKVQYLGDRAQHAGYARYVDWLNTFVTPEDFSLRRFIESPVAHPSVMARRHVMQAHPYRDGDFPEDYDLWLRFLQQGLRFATVSAEVLAWRDHGSRASRTDSRYDLEKFFIHKAIYLAMWLKERGQGCVTVWSGGRRTRRRVDALTAEGIEINQFVDVHPRRIGQEIQGVRVVSPADLYAGEKTFVVVYVSSSTVREIIVQSLSDNGFVEGENFICAS